MLPLNRNIVTLELRRVWVQKCCHRAPQKFSHWHGPAYIYLLVLSSYMYRLINGINVVYDSYLVYFSRWNLLAAHYWACNIHNAVHCKPYSNRLLYGLTFRLSIAYINYLGFVFYARFIDFIHSWYLKRPWEGKVCPTLR